MTERNLTILDTAFAERYRQFVDEWYEQQSKWSRWMNTAIMDSLAGSGPDTIILPESKEPGDLNRE